MCKNIFILIGIISSSLMFIKADIAVEPTNTISVTNNTDYSLNIDLTLPANTLALIKLKNLKFLQAGITTISTKNEFEDKIASTAVVMFSANEWCPPCKATKPHFDGLSKEFSSINFCIVDDSNASLASLRSVHNIKGYPTFVYFKNGKEVKKMRHSGGLSLKDLKSEISRFAATCK